MKKQLGIVGKNSINYLDRFIRENNIKSIFLLHGKTSYHTTGAKSIIDSLIKNNALQFVEYYNFSINPKIEEVKKGLALFRKNHAELIIAIGGGSILDMAKLIRFLHSYDGNILHNIFEKRDELIPLIAIPTTAGSGSEATHFAVVYKNQIKYSVAHPQLLPDIAIVDPIFTYQTPHYLTVCSGFDALAQAIESYWNIFATEESEKFAKDAISLLWKHLPKIADDNSDIDSRIAISQGAFYAGKAINITKTTAPHAFAYPFTSYYNFPHGHAVALTFPFFTELNYVSNPKQWNGNYPLEIHHKKMKTLYHWLNFSSAYEAKIKMRNFINKLGLSFDLPSNFKPQLIIDNINIERLNNNPAKLAQEDIFKAIESIKPEK